MDNLPTLPEAIAPSGKTKKLDLRVSKKELSNIYIIGLSILVIVLLSFTSYAAGVLSQRANNAADQPTDTSNNITNAYWQVNKVTPLDTGLFNVELTSSIGNVRNYENLRSFGMSIDGNKFAAISASGTEIVSMVDESKLKFDPPYAFTGDSGEAITWSPDNKYFALGVFKEQAPQGTHLLVYGSDGVLVKDIEVDLAYNVVNSKAVVIPVRFSPTADIILARTYSRDDLTDETAISAEVLKVPASLEVFDTTGKVLKEYEIPKAVDENSNVLFTWAANGKSMLYLIQAKDKPVDYSRMGLFTRIAI